MMIALLGCLWVLMDVLTAVVVVVLLGCFVGLGVYNTLYFVTSIIYIHMCEKYAFLCTERFFKH